MAERADLKSVQYRFESDDGDQILAYLSIETYTNKMTITPSAQQQAIIDAVGTAENIGVLAYAGTGKSTTLRLVAQAHPDNKFLYVVYNKSQQIEAANKMPTNVEVRTGDSLAWRYVDLVYEQRGRLLADRLSGKDPFYLTTSKEIAEYFSISRYDVIETINTKQGDFDKEKFLTIHQTISHIKKAIEKFCSSEDLEININHFNRKFSYPLEAVRDAKAIWNSIKDIEGRMKIGFPHIAKLWALTNPDLSFSLKNTSVTYDILMVDEAQDTNPVFGKVYRNQPAMQKIYVGDPYQSIYGFRGAGNEFNNVHFDLLFPLTESYRFGSALAEKANNALEKMGATEKIIGLGDDPEDLIPVKWDVILCRTNAGVIRCIFKHLEEEVKINVSATYAQDLTTLLETIAWFWGYLQEKPKLHPDLEGYESKAEILEAIDEGEETQMVVEVIGLLNSLGYESMKSSLLSLNARGKKDRIEITTAHKSKGSEWDNVMIWNDFRGPVKDNITGKETLPSFEELKVGYVAVTRARKHLSPGSLDYLVKNKKDEEEEGSDSVSH